MTTETKMIANLNMTTLLIEFQEHVQLGWELDINNPYNMWGILHEIGMKRTDKSVAAMVERANGAPPKMTPAESLRLARDARAAKRAAEAKQ